MVIGKKENITNPFSLPFAKGEETLSPPFFYKGGFRGI
jgi:hypothetical protein